jgi:hypothetical protein
VRQLPSNAALERTEVHRVANRLLAGSACGSGSMASRSTQPLVLAQAQYFGRTHV